VSRLRSELSAIALAALLLGGCATPLDHREDLYTTFQGALSACRQQQAGRGIRKFRLPPTHPHVAECLKRHGWNSNGTRRSTEDKTSPSE
jgi:hypothetical protein